MIAFLVCASPGANAADAFGHERGWVKNSAVRWATPQGDDVRVIRRVSELAIFSNGVNLIKGPDYEDGPVNATDGALAAWVAEKEQFDGFVAGGAGRWVEV